MTENEVTEKEAIHTKWCPMSLISGPFRTCLGSDCMGWRWTGRERKVGDADVGEPTGYCGLTGRPRHE